MKKTGIAAGVAGLLIVLICSYVRRKESASIGVIGGADGPTAILVAGPGVGAAAAEGILLGIALAVAGWMIWFRKRK